MITKYLTSTRACFLCMIQFEPISRVMAPDFLSGLSFSTVYLVYLYDYSNYSYQSKVHEVRPQLLVLEKELATMRIMKAMESKKNKM